MDVFSTFSAVADQPARISCNGQTYTVHPLRAGDYRQIAAAIRQRRLDLLLGSIVVRSLPPETLGLALAKLAAEPIPASAWGEREVVNLQIWHALRRDTPAMSLEDIENMPPLVHGQLVELLNYLNAGEIPSPQEDGEADTFAENPMTG